MKSSAENASASHTCMCSLAGTFSSDSSQEKKLACYTAKHKRQMLCFQATVIKVYMDSISNE